MCNTIRLSVIIPMYQSEKHILECIQSVCSQKVCGLEIICVDDGSTDNTCNHVMRKMKSDDRIQLLRLDHAGVSKARNAGIYCAKGEYLLFLDADDKLCSNSLASMLKKAEKKQADILVFSGTTSAPYSTPLWIRDAFSAHNRTVSSFFPELFLCERSCRPSACNKLYRRELIRKHGIYFPENLSLAEDHVFQFYAFPKARRIVFTSRRLYFYRIYQSDSTVGTYERDHGRRKTAHFKAMQLAYEHWEHEGYFKMKNYRRVFLLCYLEMLFIELEKGDWNERCLTAGQIYQQLLPLEDIWNEASEQMEIVILLKDKKIHQAEQKLALYHHLTRETKIRMKITAPVRYAKRVGLRSTFEHYVGRYLKTEP